jgi:chromosome partitioning protein
LKGGVGKTTIAANIGAYLASHPDWKRRVLLVDLDYQGSLSSMAFPDDTSWIPPSGTDSVATRAISGDLQPSIFLAACKEVRQEPRLRVVTAYYDLAQADNRLTVEWLLNLRKPDRRTWRKWLSDLFVGKVYQANEMRYNLAQLLHSEAVRDNFDLIIIDCPPRLTSGTIQALCASSHVLVPTILDKASAESVASFCTQLETMKRRGLCPYLRHLGIVATRFTPRLKHIDGLVQKITDELKSKNIRCGFLPARTFIPQTVVLVREADEGIAYFNLGNDPVSQNAKKAIAELAHSVAHQAGVAPLLAYEVTESESIQLPLLVAAE